VLDISLVCAITYAVSQFHYLTDDDHCHIRCGIWKRG